MASGIKTGTVDLDDHFDPYVEGTKPAATGYKVGSTDLNQRYAPLVYGQKAAATGLTIAGRGDLNTQFAKKGTANYITIKLQNITITGTGVGYAEAGIMLNADGSANQRIGTASPPDIPGVWMRPLSEDKAGDYEVMAEKLSSHAVDGTFGSWLRLSTLRQWRLIQATDGSATAQIRLDIRKRGTTTVIATCVVTLKVIAEYAG